MEIYKLAVFFKQTMFSQTPLLPSSLFEGLIEKFSPRGGKLSEFDVVSPLAPLWPDLSVLFVFPGSNPFSAAVFRSYFPLNIQPTKQEGKEKCGCVSKHHRSPA